MFVSEGSSPQVRGIFLPSRHATTILRIIPAGAGHLKATRPFTRELRDHPRRCGAFSISYSSRVVTPGSSPQVRGICSIPRSGFSCPGIIPAGAGHLSQRASFIGFIGDHPRRCGAFGLYGFIEVDCEGSSPQVRGICRVGRCVPTVPGIIPAGAGHLKWSICIMMICRDHPRRCGAFLLIITGTARLGGSSPQVRGILPTKCGRFSSGGDHPRRCGAFKNWLKLSLANWGSSPQVRGICVGLCPALVG